MTREPPTALAIFERRLTSLGRTIDAQWGSVRAFFDDGAEVGINPDVKMDTMSLIKVPLLVALMRRVDRGEVDLDGKITLEDDHCFLTNRCAGAPISTTSSAYGRARDWSRRSARLKASAASGPYNLQSRARRRKRSCTRRSLDGAGAGAERVMKIKAAVLEQMGLPAPYAQSRPLKVQDVELEVPGPGEALIRIVAAGLCHSDLSVINGDRPRPLPMALGHEAAGVVEEVGPFVDDLKKGDHVVCVFVPSCGHCGPCTEGRPALCEPGAAHNGAGDLLSGARRLSRGGAPVNHHCGVSCFAEYATVSRRSLVPIPDDVPLHIAALVGCAVLTGTGAVFNGGDVKPGGTTAVVGLGGVGLAAVLGAVAAGAETIVAVDRLQAKLEAARELGATHLFRADDPDVIAKVREATKGGVETVLEFAGVAKALELAYAITRRGGVTVTAGLPHPKAMLSLPAVSLVAEERTLKGSYLGSGVPSRHPAFPRPLPARQAAGRQAADAPDEARRDQRRLRPSRRWRRHSPDRRVLKGFGRDSLGKSDCPRAAAACR